MPQGTQLGVMHSGKHATLSIQWLDSNGGEPVPVDGATAWVSSNPLLVECVGAPGNPLIANLFAPGPLGTARISATVDADLGAGTRPVTATMDITVQ